MGASLPRPVESVLVERHTGYGFRAAVAEMNGWRTNMEDSHVVHIRDDWAFFGVFDGHGGAACAAFVANRLPELLAEEGCPLDDAAVRSLCFRVDEEFLESSSPVGGSTGTMCIVHRPQEGGKHRLRVANIGDSRILLGKRSGLIVPGRGTDHGLTTDHKPNLPGERRRIERCGGTVVMAEGNVPRVNGDLAVSRAFGDAGHKRTGGPAPEDRPVTADPELVGLECGEDDFVLLVCDGVSEGRFPNAQVVQLAAQVLKESGDPGQAARAVVARALERGSRDNISCMMVLLDAATGAEQKVDVEFLPGPVSGLGHSGFRSAYQSAAQRAGLSLDEALGLRFRAVRALEAQLVAAKRPRPDALRDESALFQDGPPCDDGERAMWFRRWLRDLPTDDLGPNWTPAASAAGSPFSGPAMLETETGGVAVALVVTVLGGVLSRHLGSRFGASPGVQGIVIVVTLIAACLAWGVSSRVLRRSRQKAKDL